MTNLLLFGVIAASTAALALAAMTNFHSERSEFGHRFFYFLWRYCLPIVAFEEVILRVFYGRFYP